MTRHEHVFASGNLLQNYVPSALAAGLQERSPIRLRRSPSMIVLSSIWQCNTSFLSHTAHRTITHHELQTGPIPPSLEYGTGQNIVESMFHSSRKLNG